MSSSNAYGSAATAAKPPPPRYRLYLDESGDHAYKKLHEVSHRYLGLLGIWCRQKDHYVSLSDDLEQLKRQVFGPRPDDPICLHREDIINKRGPFYVLQDTAKQNALNDGLLEVIERASFRLICIVIDKQAHSSRYSSPMHAYHYCMTATLQRYCGWLNYVSAVGDVMAEARGKQEDRQLDNAYSNIYESGMLYMDSDVVQRALTSRSLKLKNKEANIAGLQLADLLAHPTKQWVLWQKGIIAEPRGYGRQLIDVARPKLNKRQDTGQVEGYGWKLL